MKKLPLFLFIATGLLVIGFAIRLITDYLYHYEFSSFPFYCYVLERGVEFIIPAIACFVAGMIIRKKQK